MQVVDGQVQRTAFQALHQAVGIIGLHQQLDLRSVARQVCLQHGQQRSLCVVIQRQAEGVWRLWIKRLGRAQAGLQQAQSLTYRQIQRLGAGGGR